MTGLVLGGVVAFALLMVIATVRSLIIICPPNRVAVISGRNRQLSDGRTVGYRAIRGGRTLRVPLLERVSWMELNTNSMVGRVTRLPDRDELGLDINEQLIVEFYSR